MHDDHMADLEVLLGHTFRSRTFLLNALSHSSIKNERRPSNERLEFLGDSILGMLVSDALYRRFADSDEGTLTRIKSQAVSRATLQRVAAAMGLDRYIMVGKGVAKREIPASLLGNLFEAIVGAIYLDAGLAAVRKFVMRHLDIVIEEIVQDRAERNYQSMLQQHCQREMQAVPTYRVLREGGPAHSRHFDVAVTIGGKEYGRARAVSKKEAEQGAARAAMIHFRVIEENAHKPARGAGSILRVGPESSARKARRKSGRRRPEGAATPEPAAPAPAAAEQPRSQASGAKASSGRRRGGRRRAGRRAAAAPEPAPGEGQERQPEEKAAPKKAGPSRKKPVRRKAKTTASKTKAKKKAAPKEAKSEAAPEAATTPVKKKSRRRGGRKKKKSEGERG
jgi:ribonuclease-3